MKSSPNMNGTHAEHASVQAVNPYVDALSGDKPPEIVDFEITTYPYANVVPPMSRISAPRVEEAPPLDGYQSQFSPWLRAISIFLLAGMLLAVVLGVATHFYG